MGGRAFIKFKNGVHGAIFAEAKGYFFFEFDVVGSLGRIRIGNNNLLEYYRPSASRHYTGFKELSLVEFPAFEEVNIWTAALSNLLDAMEGRAESRNKPVDGLPPSKRPSRFMSLTGLVQGFISRLSQD